MDYIKTIDDYKIKIYYIKLNNIFTSDYKKLVDEFCNSNDMENLNKFIYHEDKYRHLASIILQKYVTKKFNNHVFKNISYRDLFINRNQKPYIKISNNNFFSYNVSHDENMIVITFSQTHHVGIDIMKKEKEEQLEKINLFYNQIESNINKLKLWTLIESYYKCLGTGIVNVNDRGFYFVENNNIINIYNRKNNKLIETDFFSFEIDNYIISICLILSH